MIGGQIGRGMEYAKIHIEKKNIWEGHTHVGLYNTDCEVM